MGQNPKDQAPRLNRRDAIKLSALASTTGLLSTTRDAAAEPYTPRVGPVLGPGHLVKVHMPGMRQGPFPDPGAAKQMVELAVKTLAGEPDLKKAWGKFIKPDDRVGIKINALGARFASSMKEVVDPIVEGVRSAGVPDENIMIYDQYRDFMLAARFRRQGDPTKLRVIPHEVMGYEQTFTESAGGGIGRLAKTLLWTTAVINVPVIKDHDLAGITCAIKNMVCGSVERPPMMHRRIHTALPHFYSIDPIHSRVRLTLCDGSFCMYEGGPQYNAAAMASHDSIYATTDPVAMDAIALDVVDKFRKENNLKTVAEVGRPATFVQVGEEIGLGVGSLDKIHVETIELPPFTAGT